MSYYIYSFNIKKVKSVKEYLFILKNCLRLAYKNSIHNNSFNKRVHLRYCKEQNNYFYLINSSLNKNYFGKDQCIFKNFNITETLELLKLNKYKNRCIEFELDKECNLYPIALYNFANKNIILAYDSIFNYFNDIGNNKIISLNLQVQINDYQSSYIKFLNYIKSKSLLEEKLEKYFNLSLKTTDVKMSYSLFDEIFKTNSLPLKNHMFYYIIYLLSIEFNRFINREYSLKDIDFCLYDKDINKIIKFPFNFYKKNYQNIEKELLPPLLPVSF